MSRICVCLHLCVCVTMRFYVSLDELISLCVCPQGRASHNTYTHTHTHTQAHMYVYTCIQTYVYTYMHITYIRIYVCIIHTYIFTHLHITDNFLVLTFFWLLFFFCAGCDVCEIRGCFTTSHCPGTWYCFFCKIKDV